MEEVKEEEEYIGNKKYIIIREKAQKILYKSIDRRHFEENGPTRHRNYLNSQKIQLFRKMSSSKSSRRRLEGTVKVKLDRSAKDSPINGTDNSEEDHNSQDDSDSESRVKKDVKSKRSAGASKPMNYSVYSLSDDVKKLIERVTCCSCGKQVNVMNYGAVRRHPWLKVVTCKKCFKFLKSGPFTLDNEGVDEQCRWCGDGGRLYGCDFCHNCFCRSCIKRNLGRSEATKMEEEDGSKWHCYMCKPKKIKKLVEDCDKIMDYIAKEEKRDREAEERRQKREAEKAARKAKEDSKERDSKVKVEEIKNEDDKGSVKKGFPAPKDKSELTDKLKKEVKAEVKEIKQGTSSAKSTEPELIILDDSPMKISEHHRSRGYRPDPKTGVLQVQKANNGVLEVMMGPKMNQPVVNPLPGRIEKAPVVIPIIQKGPITAGGSKLKNTPGNDLNAFRCSILPMNIDATLEKITTRSQALQLELSSAKTDLAIAKLSHVNMYQARQRACNQVRTSLEKFINTLREIWGVQFIAKIGQTAQASTVENVDTSATLFKVFNNNSTDGVSNATSTPVKTNDRNSGLQLNESIIPIEIDSPTNAEKCVKKTSADGKDAATNKTEKAAGDKQKEGSLEKEVHDVDADDQSDMEVDQAEDDGSKKKNKDDESSKKKEKEDVVSKKREKDDDISKKKSKGDDSSKKKENDENGSKDTDNDTETDKNPTSSDEVEMECQFDDDQDEEPEEMKSPKKTEKKKTDSEDDEEVDTKDKSLDSENTAAELELLKQIADELNEKEFHDNDDDDDDEAMPRRSTRAKKTAETEVKADSDSDHPARRSRRQKPKTGEEKSDEKTVGKTSKNRSESRSKTSKSPRKNEKDVSDDDSSASDEGNVKEGKEKTSKHTEKSKKSRKVYDDSDEDTIDEDSTNKNNKTKSKSESGEKRDKDKKSKDSSSAGDSSSKSNDKSKGKDSKVGKSDRLSEQIPSGDSESTEVEDKKGDEKKVKSPSKSKGKEKKSPSKKKVVEDVSPDDKSDDTDSSDMSFEEFGKKKKKRPKKEKNDEGHDESKRSSRRNTRQSNKKSAENNPSDSDTDFDADLEKEITSLSKETKLTRKKQSSDKGGKKESSKVKEDRKEGDRKRSGKSKESRHTRVVSSEDELSDPDSDFDADLEKEINTLSKETRLTRRKINHNEKDSGKKDSSKTRDGKKDDKKKSTKKQESMEESDLSSNDDMIPDDVDDSEEDTDNLSASQLKKLKQAGKAALEDSDEGDDVVPEEISSDSSDPEVSFPKLGSSKKGKKHDLSDASDDSDFVSTKKTKRLRNKLLDAKISDSESDTKKKGKKGKRGAKRKNKVDSDAFSELSDEEENRKRGKGKKRRRIKKMTSSDEEKGKEPGEDDEIADEDDDNDDEKTPGGHLKRKHIRKVIGSKKLKDETKAAQKAEEERRKRIEEKQKEYNMYVEVEENQEEEEELPEGTERELSTPVKTDSLAKILGSPRKVPITTKCVLEMDKEKKEPLIEVDRTLIRKLKPHQVEAVRFMYNCCVETLDQAKNEKGSGCILAHCMGLGKTLSVITFVHTMLSNKKLTKMSKCLVVCPLNTVLNWVNEFEIWLEDVDFEIEIYEMSRVKQNFERAQMLKEWHEGGAGVMILGYDMYRNLVTGSHCKNKKQKKIFYETLAEPGPDLTVCDEGHILKNDATSLSKAMSKIKSPRRVVLTGTPLQNNLGEYHCMVNFVKPSLLGTRKEFNNRFNNPITNGQCKDSTAFDVKLMKRRAHILHELLAGCVQRKDYSALTKFLPPKFEYVISVRLATVQMSLYEKYLELVGSGEMFNKGARLFRDYQALMRIWTHPWVLRLDEIRQENKRQFDDSDEDSFVDDGSDSDSFVDSTPSSSSGSDDEASGGSKKKNKRKTRGKAGQESSSDESKKGNQDEVVKKWTSKRRGNEEGAGSSWMEDMGYGNPDQKELSSEWWAEFVKEHDESNLELSGKLVLLFEILKMCEEIGDKVLVFSQSLLSLDIIEDFLQKVEEAQEDNPDQDKSSDSKTDSKSDPKPSTSSSSSSNDTGEEKKEKTEAEKNKENLSRYGRNWTKGADYFRMDGSTNSQNRKAAQDMFNDSENFRARLFLISTKAGSLGINLVSANRVIIFDASWNPSHDIQSIFRVYRFGQVKPVYVYRFLAQGTMEEKIYERQVTKQSLSQRVVDEHQIARHFSANDLQELYRFSPDRLDDPEKKDRPLPMLPKDHMLAELMTNNKEWVVTYHEHDSLLENVVEQELTEDEKKAAWEDYENEKKGLNRVQQMMGSNVSPAFYASQQMSMQNLLLQGQANLGQAAVLQIVQDLKVRFPNLPPEVFQQRVQAVLRQVLAQQIMQQSALQRQHVEQQRLTELNRLNQMKQQIQRQQAMISNPQNVYYGGGTSSRMPQVQSLLSGNMSGLRPQTLNQLNARSNAPIDLTGQSSSSDK
ncbi:hypothetical protein ACF0H5_010356 [Mactra antiquata]